MKKLISVFAISSLLLTGCFGGDEENTDTTGQIKAQYQTDEFSLIIPNDWEIIEQGNFRSGTANNIVVGFRNNIRNEIYTASTIVREVSGNFVSSQSFAQDTKTQLKNSLIGYNEFSMEAVEVEVAGDEAEGIILAYQGKTRDTNPIINYQQLFLVANGKNYTAITSSQTNEEESVVNNLQEMLTSFSLN